MKAFITSPFSYCTLLRMHISRNLKNRINKILEQALRLIYQNNALSITKLIERDNSVAIHQRNLQ